MSDSQRWHDAADLWQELPLLLMRLLLAFFPHSTRFDVEAAQKEKNGGEGRGGRGAKRTGTEDPEVRHESKWEFKNEMRSRLHVLGGEILKGGKSWPE
jgi:hypothetical protein